jgi:hypothetical protein
MEGDINQIRQVSWLRRGLMGHVEGVAIVKRTCIQARIIPSLGGRLQTIQQTRMDRDSLGQGVALYGSLKMWDLEEGWRWVFGNERAMCVAWWV